MAVDDVIVSAAGSGCTLRGQNLETIAFEWLRFPRGGPPAVAFGMDLGDQRSKRTRILVWLGRPVEPVLQTGRTAKLLGEFENPVAGAIHVSIFALCRNIGVT